MKDIVDKIPCSLCGEIIESKESHNSAPLEIKGRVCTDCFYSVVVPARLEDLNIQQ